MRWVIITGMYNAADVAAEFCRYHFDLGVDKIFAADYGSEDGTIDTLTSFVRSGLVEVVPLPTHRFVDYDPSNVLLRRVRMNRDGDWVSFLDPDEFLRGPDDIKGHLTQCWLDGVEVLKVQRRNLIGVGTVEEGMHCLEHLTLKVIVTDARVSNAKAQLSSPWIFSHLPPKVMLRADKENLSVATGDHDVLGADKERIVTDPSMEILHLPIRGYEAFERKVESVERYFAANPEFKAGQGWHWRRWIGLLKEGQLRKEYESQFLDRSLAESLVAKGYIVRETRLADWLPQQFAN